MPPDDSPYRRSLVDLTEDDTDEDVDFDRKIHLIRENEMRKRKKLNDYLDVKEVLDRVREDLEADKRKRDAASIVPGAALRLLANSQ